MTTEAEVAARGRVARLFGLKGKAWMRHANPLSVWTRFSCLSLIALAIWSREWLGWFALVPVALSVVWLFVNPLLFRVPSSTRTWASRGVFGERIWVDREKVELPAQFRSRAPMVANALSLVGLAFPAYGLVTLSGLPTVGGIVIVHGQALGASIAWCCVRGHEAAPPRVRSVGVLTRSLSRPAPR